MRLFVAVWPSAAVVDAVRGMPRPETDALRWTTEDQWHVTLRFLGEAEVDGVALALAGVDAPATTAVMGPVTGRFGRRIVHVPVSGLDDVAAAVWSALGPEDRPFTGHLTLARARDRRGVDLRPYCGVPIAGEWRVDEITLVASHMSPKGARYEIVERFPLP